MLNHYQNIKNREATSVYITGAFLQNLIGSLTFAIYTIFLYKNGLNLFQISMMNFVFMLAVAILEVPTGAIADMLGRKRTVLLASVFAVAGYLLYPLYRNVYNFAIAEILIALSATLAYGAFEAWMVKTSEVQGFKGKVDFVFSQANIYARIAGIVGGIVGAYFAVINLAGPFYVGAVLAIFNFFYLLFFMVDDSKSIKGLKIKESFTKVKNIAVNATRYSLTHKVLLWVVLGNAFLFLCFQPFNMFWGIRFNAMLPDRIEIMGWLWAVIALFSLFGAFISDKLIKKNINYAYIMVVSTIIISALILLSASTPIVFLAISSFLVHEIGRGMTQPVQLAYVNRCASEDMRATIISFESMATSFGAAIGLVIFGLIANKTSIETSWIIGAILVLAAIPLYLKAGRQDHCKI